MKDKPFIKSGVCIGGRNCEGCRNKEAGRAVRKSWRALGYVMPDAPAAAPDDWACPPAPAARGLDWGFTGKPVQVTVARVDRAGRPPEVKPISFDQWPKLFKGLAKRRQPGEVGCGDTFDAQIRIAGKNPAAWLIALSRIPCGCSSRRAKWNALYNYSMINEASRADP